jgi:asparaginyl-tRNA synthetase
MMAHRKVYCFGPTFRAEKSKTRRHLTEFWMVEPEIAYADIDDVCALAEDFVYELVQRVLRERRMELELLGRDLTKLEAIQKPFNRITYSQAAELLHGDNVRRMLLDDLERAKARVEELKKSIAEKEAERAAPGTKEWKADKLAHELLDAREELADQEDAVRNIPHHMELAANFAWGGDLGGSDETIIARLHERPVFVTHYPRACKAFYMKRNADDPRVVKLDLLAPEATARSSAAASARMISTSCWSGCARKGSTKRTTSGTSICAATAPSRTAASAWAWSARWPGSAA